MKAPAKAPRPRARRGAPVLVREASPLDLDEVTGLRLALLRDPTATPVARVLHPDAEGRARRIFARQLRSRHEVTLLAERGETVVGILRVTLAPASPLHADFRHAYLSSAYVLPRARRGGVLRTLVRHGLAWCEAHGVAEVRLHSAVGNRPASAAWDRLGFAVAEELRRLPLRHG